MRIGKLLLVITASVMVMALAACGSEEQAPDEAVAPDGPSQRQEKSPNAPEDDTLTLTVPKMQRISDSPVPNTFGEDEEALRNYVGIHLDGTGFPWDQEANVYIAGHRLGYPGYPSFLAFYDIDALQNGDRIFVEDADGREYTYQVFQTLEVNPTDLYVLEPLEGRNVLTLQTCTLPDYARRVVVQAELQES